MRVPKSNLFTRLPFKFWLSIVRSVASSPTKIGPLTQGFQVSSGPPRTGSHVLPGSSKWNRTFGKVSREKLFFPRNGVKPNQFEWGETSKIRFLTCFTVSPTEKLVENDAIWHKLGWAQPVAPPFGFLNGFWWEISMRFFQIAEGTSWNSVGFWDTSKKEKKKTKKPDFFNPLKLPLFPVGG